MEWDWAKTGPNHWGDVLSGCFAVASMVGLYDSTDAVVTDAVRAEGADIPAPKPKRRVRYVLKRRR